MSERGIADGPLLLRPDMASGADLPEHLKGSRGAIFHLLRVGRAQKEMARRPAVSAVPPRPKPRPSHERMTTPASAARTLPSQGFFMEDQFEFLSTEARLKV